MEWLTKYPDRFVRECAELDKLAQEVDWLTVSWSITPEDYVLEVQLDMTVHDRVYKHVWATLQYFPMHLCTFGLEILRTGGQIISSDPEDRYACNGGQTIGTLR